MQFELPYPIVPLPEDLWDEDEYIDSDAEYDRYQEGLMLYEED